MTWECTKTPYNFTIHDDDAAARASTLGCPDLFRAGAVANTTAVATRCRRDCPFLRAPVFNITHAVARNANANASAAAAEITTRVKTSKDCRGVGWQHTCRVVPAVVDYAVDFTNSTVALTDGADAATVVLPRQPRNASQQLTDAEAWTRIAATLFPPVSVEYQRWTAGNATLRFGGQCDGRQGAVADDSRCDKQLNSTSGRLCPVGQAGLRYLMLLYKEDEGPNSTSCELAYRDPMEVSKNIIYMS